MKTEMEMLYDFSEESINKREENCKKIIRDIEIISNTFFEKPSYKNIERAEDFIYRLLSVPMPPRFHNVSLKNKNMYFKLSEKKNFYFEDINKYYKNHFNISLERKNNRAIYDTREMYNQELIYFLLGNKKQLYFIHYNQLLTMNNIYNEDFKLIGIIICDAMNEEEHNVVAEFLPPKASNTKIEEISEKIKINMMMHIDKNSEFAKKYFSIINYIYNACIYTPLLRYIKLPESFIFKYIKNIEASFLYKFYPKIYKEKQQPIILNYSSSVVKILDDEYNVVKEFIPKEKLSCKSSVKCIDNLEGIPINTTVFDDIVGLPKVEEKTYYIVDKSILYALPNTYRKDLLIPYDPVKDTNGSVLGYKGLLKNICRL